jgi:NTP pyrophosphatase (non-canonical NTP hydrolase)
MREMVRDKYSRIDSKSSPLFLLAVLVEEVGELAEAVRKREKKSIEEELADVLFMVVSLANYFEVNPENVVVDKYIKGDPSKRWDLES